jgi:hypothetical protein
MATELERINASHCLTGRSLPNGARFIDVLDGTFATIL